MSDFKRIQRLAKSLIPRFPKNREKYWEHSDVRNMINDLGLQMSPEVLSKLVNNDQVLDDFISSIYQLERRINREVITEFATIDTDYDPKVYVEDGEVGFSITHKGKEIVFAEYKLGDLPK